MQRFLVMIVGVIFLAVGGFMFYRNNTLAKNCTEEVVATVVDMKQEIDTDSEGVSSYLYYPIIEYKAGEENVRATMDNGSSTPAYEINETITILYNPKKVKQFIAKGDSFSNIFSYVFLGLGVLITGYGAYTAFKKN